MFLCEESHGRNIKSENDNIYVCAIMSGSETKTLYKYTVKPVSSSHSKMDKTKVLKTNGSLMKVESIAECSKTAFCNTFDLH